MAGHPIPGLRRPGRRQRPSWPSSSSPATTPRPRPARRWRWSPEPPPSTASPAARWGTRASSSGDGWRIRVSNTQKLPNDLIVHQGKVEAGIVRVNDPAHLAVDAGAAPPHHAPTTPPPTSSRRSCGATWATTSSSPAPWWTRSACASTSPTTRPSAPRNWRPSSWT